MPADLWSESRERKRSRVHPLAFRMRPRTLDEVAGQRHILKPGKLLRRMIDSDTMISVVFHGPPGTGKTTLAEVIARHSSRHFFRENAATVGVARIREVLASSANLVEDGQKPGILFLDEIHRFTKAQQDVLLGDVERGLVTLIGATTENPMFAVNSALVSRSTLFRLEPLSEDDVVELLRRAIADAERGFGHLPIKADDEALKVWAIKSDGDARRALGALEVAVLSSIPEGAEGTPPTIVIDRALAEESIQQKAALYDARGGGDQHYDHASALIKSVRGSDPDAAVYWMARMLEGGEDPRFIARRLAILASEDIGNADPRAIMVAEAAWSLCERLGMPECRITLSQCAIYLALAPKSNASYSAIDAAIADVREGRTLPIPANIRDPNANPDAKGRPGAKTYSYTHNSSTIVPGFGPVDDEEYLTVDKTYYTPTTHGVEKLLGERMEAIRKARERTHGA